MKLKIEELARKEVNTPNGRNPTAWKVGVRSGGKWYSCFEAEWNKGWNVGQVLDVDVEQNGQFWNIVPPKKKSSDSIVLDEIKGMLSQVMTELLAIKAMLSFPTKSREVGPDEEVPVPKDEDEPTLPF
jgi:hypothetical protein